MISSGWPTRFASVPAERPAMASTTPEDGRLSPCLGSAILKRLLWAKLHSEVECR